MFRLILLSLVLVGTIFAVIWGYAIWRLFFVPTHIIETEIDNCFEEATLILDADTRFRLLGSQTGSGRILFPIPEEQYLACFVSLKGEGCFQDREEIVALDYPPGTSFTLDGFVIKREKDNASPQGPGWSLAPNYLLRGSIDGKITIFSYVDLFRRLTPSSAENFKVLSKLNMVKSVNSFENSNDSDFTFVPVENWECPNRLLK